MNTLPSINSISDINNFLRKAGKGKTIGDFLEWSDFEISHAPRNVIVAFVDEAIRVAGNETKRTVFQWRLAVIMAILTDKTASFKIRFWRFFASDFSFGEDILLNIWYAARAAEDMEGWETGDQPWESIVRGLSAEIKLRKKFTKKKTATVVESGRKVEAFELPAFVAAKSGGDTPAPSPRSDTAGATYRKNSSGLSRAEKRRMWWRINREQAEINRILAAASRKGRKRIPVVIEEDVEPVAGERMTAAQYKRSLRPFRLADPCCVLQGGRKTTREERDAAQKKAAKQHAKAAYKAQPKAQREREVLLSRDKRQPVLQSGMVTHAAAAGAAVLMCKVLGTLRKADKVATAMTSVLETIKSFAKEFERVVKSPLWVVPLVMVCFYSCKTMEGWAFKAIPLALSAVVGKSLWKSISNFFPGGNRINQSGSVDALPRLLATLCAFSIFKGKFNSRDVTEFMKRIAMIDRVAGGFDTFTKWTLEAIEAVVNYVREHFGKEKIQLFRDAHSGVKEWFKRVAALKTKDVLGDAADSAAIDEMVELAKLSEKYKNLYRGTDFQRNVDNYAAELANLMLPYAGVIAARDNFRQEPVMLTLLGPPGIGKTLLCTYAVVTLLRESGTVTAPGIVSCTKEMWQKGSSEYWNGYCGQKALIMDDIFQARTTPGSTDNEYMDTIRMISSWIMPLNMADVGSKGKINMTSPIVFTTSNVPCVISEASMVVNEPGAVVRRIAFPYAVRLKPAYVLDNKLNFDMFQAELDQRKFESGSGSFPWHIWEVAKHDFATGETSNHWIPIRDMLTMAAATIRNRRLQHANNLDALTRYVAGYDKVIDEAQNEPEVVPQGGLLLSMALSIGTMIGCKIRDPLTVHMTEEAIRLHKVAGISLSDTLKMADEWLQEQTFKQQRINRLTQCIWFGAAGVFTVSLVAYFLKALWSGFCFIFNHKEKDEDKPAVQSNVPKVRSAVPMVSGDKVPKLQSGISQVNLNVYSNSYKLLVEEPGYCDILGQIIFLESDLAVQPYHFTQRVRHCLDSGVFKRESLLQLRHSRNSEFTFHISVGAYLDLPRHCFDDCDVEFIKFKNVRAHKNVVANFMREKEVKYVSNLQGILLECTVDRAGTLQKENMLRERPFDGGDLTKELKIATEWGPKVIRRALRYRKVYTDVGSCGAPACIANTDFSGRSVYGIHVAGVTDRGDGYCAFVTREMIDKAKSSLGIIEDHFIQDFTEREHGVALQVGDVLPFENKGSFLAIGIAEVPVNLSQKSRFYPTEHYGKLGEYDARPAALGPVYRDGELVYPMENAVKPYQSPLYLYEMPYMSTAMHVAMRPFFKETQSASRRIYTFDEAVLGVPGEKFRAIPRGTASGYPYVYDVRDGKKEFFGDDEEYDLTGDMALKLRGRVDYIIESARKGIRLSHVFVDFLKDELRSSEKVHNVATRLISSAPVDYSLAWRQYFGAFTAAAMKHNIDSGMAPGINVYTDWWKLHAHLKKHGDKCFDGDFKAFDSSEQPIVHELILDIVNKWYDDGEENARIRRVLWLDLVHSRHIGGKGKDQRYVYQWNKSLPSGHPFTTVVNSMYSLFLLVCAYIECTGDIAGYWDNVSAITYGDDNNSNVSDRVAEMYNQRTVAEVLWSKFHIKYTPGNKSQDYTDIMALEDTTFLKRGFSVGEDGAASCPLALDSFLYTFYWCKNRKLEYKIMQDVMESALEELSLHSARTWKEYAPTIARLLEAEGHVTRVPAEQNQYLLLVRSRADNWY